MFKYFRYKLYQWFVPKCEVLNNCQGKIFTFFMGKDKYFSDFTWAIKSGPNYVYCRTVLYTYGAFSNDYVWMYVNLPHDEYIKNTIKYLDSEDKITKFTQEFNHYIQET